MFITKSTEKIPVEHGDLQRLTEYQTNLVMTLKCLKKNTKHYSLKHRKISNDIQLTENYLNQFRKIALCIN